MTSHVQKKARLAFHSMMLLSSNVLVSGLIESLQNSRVTSSISSDLLSGCTIIGTHDGSFHCDEALAVSMLKLLPQYHNNDNTVVLRTRKADLLEKCNIVVDVGAVYDPANNRFDHHQREFTGTLDNYNTKLSSAGLVYKHFGHDIIKAVLNRCDETVNSNSNTNKADVSDDFIHICYDKIYKEFIEHIDAIDNGISITNDNSEPKYHITTSLSARVGQLNPSWNEDQGSDAMNERFKQAMMLTCSELVLAIQQLYLSWWPARTIVETAVKNRFLVHESGKLVVNRVLLMIIAIYVL